MGIFQWYRDVRVRRRRQKKIEELILTEEEVDLEGKLEDDDISVVISALARTTTLKVLDLGRNQHIGDAEVKLIADALQEQSQLQAAEATSQLQRHWSDDGVKYLADALSHSNCKLQKLHLRQQRIGPRRSQVSCRCVVSFQLQAAEARSLRKRHWCRRSQASCRCVAPFQLQAATAKSQTQQHWCRSKRSILPMH